MRLISNYLGAALIAAAVAMPVNIEVNQVQSGPPILLIEFSKANAQPRGAVRRTARRTGRRTARRVARRTSIAGCSPYRAYYNCGGVYYRPVVEGGATVYVVVNP